MALLKKTFLSGLSIGFVLGIVISTFIAISSAFYLFKDPHGTLAQWTINNAKSLYQDLKPLAFIKGYVEEVHSNLKNPRLQTISPYSFQQIDFPGSRVESSNNLLSWIDPLSDRIQQDESPPSNKIRKTGYSRPLKLTGLKGETLSFQLVLRSDRNLEGLTVALKPDPAQNHRCIQIHRFREIYLNLMIHQGGKHGPLKEISTPDPLVPFTDPYSLGHRLITNIDIHNNITQPIWFDVYFDHSCMAGDYPGILEIKDAGVIVRKTPVTFNILNIDLPKRVPLNRFMEIYGTRFWRGEMIANDDDNRTMLNRYYVLGHKYGFATNACGGIEALNIKWDWNIGKPISVDWSSYDKTYGPVLSGELTGSSPNAWCLPIGAYSLGFMGGFTYGGSSPSPIGNWKGIPDRSTRELANLIVQHWKEKGWPIQRAFVYVWDEPTHQLYYPDLYLLIADIADSLHKGSHNQIHVMLTDTPYNWNTQQIGHHKSALKGKIDIWVPADRTYIPDRLKSVSNDGERVWFYGGGPPFLGGSDLSTNGPGFRMWFWTAWKYHSNGMLYWASTFWNGNTKAINPYTNGGLGDGVMFYPGRQLHFIGLPDMNGPVPSIRMAQWRRGYEDYKYFVLLKQKGHQADADKIINHMVKRALDEGGYSPYWRNPLWEKPGNWNHDPKAWHQARLKLAKEIIQLNKK